MYCGSALLIDEGEVFINASIKVDKNIKIEKTVNNTSDEKKTTVTRDEAKIQELKNEHFMDIVAVVLLIVIIGGGLLYLLLDSLL